jgi:hypothetical protein
MKQLYPCLMFLFCIKLSCAQTTFQRAYDVNGQIEDAYSLSPTSDGGYLIGGSTTATGNNSDLFLLKVNATGDTLWTKIFGTPTPDFIFSVKRTFDGGNIVAGYNYTGSLGLMDAFVIKLDSAGGITWSKNVGSFLGEQCREIQQTSDSGYVIFGISKNTSGAIDNVYIARLNATGNIMEVLMATKALRESRPPIMDLLLQDIQEF